MKSLVIFHFNLIPKEKEKPARQLPEPIKLGFVEKEPILGFVEPQSRRAKPFSQTTVTREFNKRLGKTSTTS